MTDLNGQFDQTKGLTSITTFLDSGSTVGQIAGARVSYDWTGDGVWDRVEVFNIFPTDPAPGFEQFTTTDTNRFQSVTGSSYQTLIGGKVQLDFYQAGGATTTKMQLMINDANAQGQKTFLSIPYTVTRNDAAVVGTGPTETNNDEGGQTITTVATSAAPVSSSSNPTTASSSSSSPAISSTTTPSSSSSTQQQQQSSTPLSSSSTNSAQQSSSSSQDTTSDSTPPQSSSTSNSVNSEQQQVSSNTQDTNNPSTIIESNADENKTSSATSLRVAFALFVILSSCLLFIWA
jgi:hypothetical protein